MRHEKLDGIKTPFEKILSAVSSVHDVAASSLTTPTGSVSFDNSDGTRTIIGAQIGNNNIATHVGDTTPPPKPIFSAKCKGGVLSVQWDGKLEGEIPPDFYCVTFCTDTRVLGALKSPGTVTTTIGDAKNNEYITVYGYSEDDACGADGSAKHNKSEKVSVKVQVVDDFEKIKDDITAFKKNADVKYAHKVDTDEATKKLTEQYEAVYTNNQKLNEKYEDVLTLKEQADELSEKLESNYYTTDKIDTMMNEQSNKSDSRISTIREQLTYTIHNITNEKESEIKQYVDHIIQTIKNDGESLNIYEDSNKIVIYGNNNNNNNNALVLYNNGSLELCTIDANHGHPTIIKKKVNISSDGMTIFSDDNFIIKNQATSHFYAIEIDHVITYSVVTNMVESEKLAIRGDNFVSVGSDKEIVLALEPTGDNFKTDDAFIHIKRSTIRNIDPAAPVHPSQLDDPCSRLELSCSQTNKYNNEQTNNQSLSYIDITPFSIYIISHDLCINGQTMAEHRKTIFLYGSWASQRYMMLIVSLNIAELYFNCDCEEWKWLYSDTEIPQEYRPLHDINDTAIIYKGTYPANIWIPGQGTAEGRPSLFCGVTGNVVGHSTWAIAGRQH